MTRPILAGYDPATLDRAPVEFGVAAARFTGADLIVASVCGEIDRPDEVLLEDADDALAELESAVGGDAPISFRELVGSSAPRALHDAAEEADAGLLVVGSSARGTVGRVLPGSTAERLMHGAPCPVAVVPREWHRGGGLSTIGVAYIDSPEAAEALTGAHALAAAAGATLRILSVVRPRSGMLADAEPRVGVQRGKTFEDVDGQRRAEAERAAQAAADALPDGVTVEVDTYVADPADTLIRVSENLDLLVCGSRGYGPLRAVMLGGVSRRIVAHAECPVLVLPRGVPAALDELVASGGPGATPT